MYMKAHIASFVGVLGACTWGSGCAVSDEVPQQIERDGQVFKIFDPNAVERTKSVRTESTELLPDFRAADDNGPPLREHSRVELADSLRLAIMHPNGHVYIAQ